MPVIAALWDDLAPGNGNIRRKTVDVDLEGIANDMVIEWNNYKYQPDGAPSDAIKFQVVLFDDGLIQINYQDLEAFAGFTGTNPPISEGSATVPVTGGISATVGIWKGGGSPADAITLPAGKFVPGPHSINGEPDSTGGDSNDSYVRMAWETGGAARDAGAITALPNALRDAFIGSLTTQIKDAAAAGEVTRDAEVIYAINLGGGAIASEGFAADPIFGSSVTPTQNPINTTSNSIPTVGIPAVKMDEVFKDAITSLSPGNNINLSFPESTYTLLTPGRYIVELFFSEIRTATGSTRFFDVQLEGKTVLDNFNIYADRAMIVEVAGNPVIELDADPAVRYTGTVKRFEVEVGADGTDGLQVLIKGEGTSPLINGIRILQYPLPGDYDRDGEVDCADYYIWRDTNGDVVPRATGADGNGDGKVDIKDYEIWATNFGDNQGNPIGDYDDNGVTNMMDYFVWKANFGSTMNLAADGNCNGVVDAPDYTIWRDTFASAIGAYKFGLLVDALDTDLPPSVVGVGLGAVAGGFHDFVLAVGSGEQLRSVPLASLNSLSITFTQAVTISQNDLVIENLDGTSPTVSSFAYEAQAHTATWTFTSSLADGRYLVRLSDAVENAENEALDGEFDNPWFLTETGTSELASGDREEGEEFRFRFTVLAGDTDHDNIDGATDYQNWQSYEPGMIYASSTVDEFDADLSFGDVSLREAVDHANTAGVPTTVDLASGTYTLTVSGTGGISQGDLDISAGVTIVGNGPGISVIDASGIVADDRIFDVLNGAILAVSRVTLTLSEAPDSFNRDGGAIRVQNGGVFDLDYSAIVGNITGRDGDGGAIFFAATGSGSIRNSVITVNHADEATGGVYLASATAGTGGTVIVGNSIIAKNTDDGTSTPDVFAGTNRSFTSEGNNRLGNVTTGFTNGVNGDYVGTPDYIVTVLADTYDGSSDPVGMSVRDAIHQANITAGAQEIWLPAWGFMLDRDRATYGTGTTDMDIAFGDLDITGSLTIRGIGTATSIQWPPGVVDRVFELVGDYNGDGTVGAADQTVWNDTQGATPDPGDITADGDDDGDIDEDDEDVWTAHFGYTFALFNVSVPG